MQSWMREAWMLPTETVMDVEVMREAFPPYLNFGRGLQPSLPPHPQLEPLLYNPGLKSNQDVTCST